MHGSDLTFYEMCVYITQINKFTIKCLQFVVFATFGNKKKINLTGCFLDVTVVSFPLRLLIALIIICIHLDRLITHARSWRQKQSFSFVP